MPNHNYIEILVPAQQPICKYHLWTQMALHNQPTMQEKRNTQAEYLGLVKTALRNIIQNVNFADPIQTRRAYKALMHDVK